MIVDENTLQLKTPVDDVWAFISKAENMVSLISQDSMTVSEIQDKPDGGYAYQVTYQFFRLKIKSSSETCEIIPGEKLVIQTQGQFNGRTIWLLVPEEEGTRLTICYEYDEPTGLPTPLTRSFTQVIIRDTLSTIADNVRSMLK